MASIFEVRDGDNLGSDRIFLDGKSSDESNMEEYRLFIVMPSPGCPVESLFASVHVLAPTPWHARIQAECVANTTFEDKFTVIQAVPMAISGWGNGTVQ